MFSLGLLLERNDPQAAHEWYERAAAAGHPDATNLLGRLPEGSDRQATQ
jgi:TPR repeat protein